MGVRRVGGEGGTGARGAVLTWILAIAVFTAAVSLLTQHHAIHDLHEPRSSHHGLRNHHRHGAATTLTRPHSLTHPPPPTLTPRLIRPELETRLRQAALTSLNRSLTSRGMRTCSRSTWRC
jgi:hypothetical protein